MQLVFLGTGAGCGVPSFFCTCKACQEARDEPRFSRTRCGLVLMGDETVLVDAPPELRSQLIRENIKKIDRFILTHWHYDHAGGLGELEFYVRTKRQEMIPTYMSTVTKEWFDSTHWFMKDCLVVETFESGYHVEIDEMVYTALDVQHAPGTFGLEIEAPSGRRTAYTSDTGPLPEHTHERLRGVDNLILDATFWGRNWMPEDHQSVESAINIGLELEAKQIFLTHLSMHHDQIVTSQELEAFLHTFGDHIHLAYDGLRIEI